MVHIRLVSHHTVSNYKRDLQRFSEFCAKNKAKKEENIIIQDVSREMIQDWLVAGHGQGLAAATLARRLASIKSLFAFALRQQHCVDNPAQGIRGPKLGKRLPKTVPQEQTTQLLKETNRPYDERELALLALLYGCGLRVSEVVGINLGDLTLQAGFNTVRVVGKGNKERIVPLPEVAVELVQTWLHERASLLPNHHALFLNRFGKRLNVRSVQRMLKDRALTTGADVSITPHRLRHSFATDMLAGGANLRTIQKMMGHASLTTTEHYTHITLPQLQQAYVDAHPRSTKEKIKQKHES